MTTNPSNNPYVGPRSFQKNEPLWGRDRELRQLTDRLLAERIVLLHAPSGAGKTSLIQAGLIVQLENEGFTVNPIIRVNLERPPELLSQPDLLAKNPGFNRYAFSTLLSLEEQVPKDERLPMEDLLHFSLEDYLKLREERESRTEPQVLIFDQFEEVLTIDPTDRAAKNAFFSGIGAALKNRNRWALFAVRTDYVGALEKTVRYYGEGELPIAQRVVQNGRDYLDAFVASEQIVIWANQQPNVQLVAIYPSEGALWQDHPLALLETNKLSDLNREASGRMRAQRHDRGAAVGGGEPPEEGHEHAMGARILVGDDRHAFAAQQRLHAGSDTLPAIDELETQRRARTLHLRVHQRVGHALEVRVQREAQRHHRERRRLQATDVPGHDDRPPPGTLDGRAQRVNVLLRVADAREPVLPGRPGQAQCAQGHPPQVLVRPARDLADPGFVPVRECAPQVVEPARPATNPARPR